MPNFTRPAAIAAMTLLVDKMSTSYPQDLRYSRVNHTNLLMWNNSDFKTEVKFRTDGSTVCSVAGMVLESVSNAYVKSSTYIHFHAHDDGYAFFRFDVKSHQELEHASRELAKLYNIQFYKERERRLTSGH
jgi:hypothetical protein